MKERIWKNHVFRPLMVVIGVSLVLFVVRTVYVPDDFGQHGDRYAYNLYREANVSEWEQVAVKYQGREYCQNCHQVFVDANASSVHSIIQCENCHGPAMLHPQDPPRLTKDTSRELCLRCHSELEYSTSGRAVIEGIDPDGHNPGSPCVTCHDPHHPV